MLGQHGLRFGSGQDSCPPLAPSHSGHHPVQDLQEMLGGSENRQVTVGPLLASALKAQGLHG